MRRIIINTLFTGMAVVAMISTPLAHAHGQAAPNGMLQGVVRDRQGLLLPGVTVTLSGPAIVGVRVATTDVNGSFGFPALPSGTYRLLCEILGFRTLEHDGLAVASGKLSAIAVTLEASPLEPPPLEPVGPPIIDPTTTGSTAVFEERRIDELPTATDVSAVLQASPGIRLRGYDVGGSHKSEQSEYDAFGVQDQHRVLNDGVDTTEGTGGAGGYYDYYAVEEFRISAQGLDVEMSTPGARVVAAWKSGSNQVSGLLHGDFEDEAFVANNLDDDLIERAGAPAGNREFYEYHVDLGGPIVTDRAWFYVAHNRFFLDRALSGRDPETATDVADFDTFTGKVNVDPTGRDRIIAFGHWSFKQKPTTGLSFTVPEESVLAQESWSWFYKGEWQRDWFDRLSSSIMVGYFGTDRQMVPTVDPIENPPRIDTATGIQSGAGFAPFALKRSKPQSTGQFNLHVPTRAGDHALKFGWDWQSDRNGRAWSDTSGAIRYLDNSDFGRAIRPPEPPMEEEEPDDEIDDESEGEPMPEEEEEEPEEPSIFVDRIQFANVPVQGETDESERTDFYVQDTWTFGRASVLLGLRFNRQRVRYAESENEPFQSDIFEPSRTAGADVFDWSTLSPRLGLTYDVTGRGQTVVKGYFGRFYANVGSGLHDANPGGRSFQIYEFEDPNENGIYDGLHELGTLLESGGGRFNTVDSELDPAYTDEISFSLEQELAPDFGVRFSYVHKAYRNWWQTNVNLAQALNLTSPVTATCTACPLGLEDAELNLLTIPDEQELLVDPRIINVPLLSTTGGANVDMNFTTWQLALHRRFRDNFFFAASFDKDDRNELRSTDDSTSPLATDPLGQEWFLNHSQDVANRHETKYWSIKLQTRYVVSSDIGLSVSLRHQSGFPWAPVHRLDVPNVGTKAIFLTDLDENRSEDVTIVDFRLDKTWTVMDRYRLTAIADVYNLMNANPETNFILRTGSQFNNVIEWLPGRTMKLGLRLQF